MTNLPPGDRLRRALRHRQSSPKTTLGFDEFIAVLVAFATIGTILFWSFSRRDSDWNLNGVLPPSPTPSLSLPLNPVPPPASPDSPASRASPAPFTPPTPLAPPPPKIVIKSPPSVTSSAFSLVTPTEQKSTIPPPIAFNDVPGDFWSRRFINALSARGIIKGFPDYTFRPNQPVNRAEFAAMLQQAFNQDLGKSSITFKDVPAKFWATPAINQAINTGFLKGYPNKIFKPEQKISRVEVLVALVSGLNLKPPATTKQILTNYQDAQDIPAYATDKIAAASANGLVINYPDSQVLAPNKAATRAEVVVMIHQALVRMGRLEAIPSPNLKRSP